MTTQQQAVTDGKLTLSHKRDGIQLAFVEVGRIWWSGRFRDDFGDVDSLAESIKEKGILTPLTITPEFELLAGERRLTAAKLAGLTHVPCLLRKKEDVLDAREVELMENVFRKNQTWDEECALVREIDKLYREKNMDWSIRKTAQLLDKGLGSVSRYLQLGRAIEIIPDLREYKTADEALKVLKKFEEQAVLDELSSRQQVHLDSGNLDKGIAAMLHLVDRNYIIGDTFKGLAELRRDGAVHIIECDPPYGINLQALQRSKDSPTANVHSYNEIDTNEYQAFLDKLTKELYRVAAPNSWLVFWFGPTWWEDVKFFLTQAGWQVDDIPAIWVKSHGQTMQPEVNLARCYEPFFLCRKGQPTITKRGHPNVFQYTGVAGNLKYHPTQRPVELIQDILETLGMPGHTVLCPFLGSGATIRAAYNLGMKVFGWDISAEYKPKLKLLVEADARAMTAQEESEDDTDC